MRSAATRGRATYASCAARSNMRSSWARGLSWTSRTSPQSCAAKRPRGYRACRWPTRSGNACCGCSPSTRAARPPRQRSSGSAAPPSGVGSTPTTCAEGEGAGGAGEGDAGGIPRRSGTPVRYRTWPCLVLPARRPTTGGPGHAATWPRSVTRCPTGRRRRTPRGASAVSAPGPALSALPATHFDGAVDAGLLHARQPPVHARPIGLVVRTEEAAQRGLLVRYHEQVRAPAKEEHVTEERHRVVDDGRAAQRQNCTDVHRVPDEVVWPPHNQLARRGEGRGCALADNDECEDAPDSQRGTAHRNNRTDA